MYNVEITTHGVGRFLDRKFDKSKFLELSKRPFNFVQEDGKFIKHYDGLAIIYNESKTEIVSFVIRQLLKKEWIKL